MAEPAMFVVRQRGGDRPFSFRHQLSDQWFDLHNPNQSATPLGGVAATNNGVASTLKGNAGGWMPILGRGP